MAVRPTRLDAVNLGIVALAAAVGLALWPQLPARLAIHFSASGTPGNYVGKTLGVVLVPLVMLATLLILEAAVRFDPPKDERTFAVTTIATMLLLAALHVLVLAWNLGHGVPFELVFFGVLLWGVCIAGYALLRQRTSTSA